jgi:hypothetical protein|tara:strand:+ start:4248 stop:4547 length:300 start_codon:yes stop_codon:yes gene_type:complete
MTKKGPLSKAEKFYIENHLDKPIEKLCKDLDRAKSTINKFLKTVAVEETEKAETLLYQQFARNNKGSTVMTENAAVHSDEVKWGKGGSTRSNQCTTRIR